MLFRLHALRFSFTAQEPIKFPASGAANILRGAFGLIFRRLACAPDSYARVFEPSAINGGPSGLKDWPRPFVFRAAHLDGQLIDRGGQFYFDVNLFDLSADVIECFAQTFAELAHEGLGPARSRVQLESVIHLNERGEAAESLSGSQKRTRPRCEPPLRSVTKTRREHSGLAASTRMIVPIAGVSPPRTPVVPEVPQEQRNRWAGLIQGRNESPSGTFRAGRLQTNDRPQGRSVPRPQTCWGLVLQKAIEPIEFELAPQSEPVSRLRVDFLTPTELKASDRLAEKPEFVVLAARARDRISTLRQLYGDGALDLDFRAFSEKASLVKMTRCDITTVDRQRRSSRTGQVHGTGGFLGVVEYEGELTEFLPFLQLAQWTGVGRQTVWGKGHIKVS